MRSKIFFVATLILVSAAPTSGAAYGQADSVRGAVSAEKARAIHTFLRLSKVADLFLFGFQEAMATSADADALPEGFLEQFEVKVRDELPEFIDMLVPIYDRHLTLEELSGLNEFLATPLGQRLVRLQMDVAPDMRELGERWGMKLVGQVLMDLANQPGK